MPKEGLKDDEPPATPATAAGHKTQRGKLSFYRDAAARAERALGELSSDMKRLADESEAEAERHEREQTAELRECKQRLVDAHSALAAREAELAAAKEQISGLRSSLQSAQSLALLQKPLQIQAERGALQNELKEVRASRDALGSQLKDCLLYTSPSPRDLSTSRMPSSA